MWLQDLAVSLYAWGRERMKLGLKMRMVVLVGTDHKFQRPVNGSEGARVESFREVIRELCFRYKVQAIAEEMNLQALQEYQITESVACQLCSELRLLHQYSDPSLEERTALGIQRDHDIELQGWRERWPREKIDAALHNYGSLASDQIREKEWLCRIQELDAWPLLFICGANHFVAFAALLRHAGVTVIEACQDWSLENARVAS